MTNRAKLISPREREGGTEKVTRENSRKFSTQDESEKEKFYLNPKNQKFPKCCTQ